MSPQQVQSSLLNVYPDKDTQIPYTNCDKVPSEVLDNLWLWEGAEVFERPKEAGKWLQFHKNGPELDAAWELAKKKYRSGELNGIFGMKVTTAMKNPRERPNPEGVLLFYCSPSDDEEHIMECGNRILEHLPYGKPIMCFKSDKQTDGGTRSTGQQVNHMYTIQIKSEVQNNKQHSKSNQPTGYNQHHHLKSNQAAPQRMPWDEDNWRK